MRSPRRTSLVSVAEQPSFPLILRIIFLLFGLAMATLGAIGVHAAAPDTAQSVPNRLLVQPRPGLPQAALDRILSAHGGKSISVIRGINVHIVQLPPQASEKAVAALLAKNPHIKFAEQDMLVKPEGTVNDPYLSNAWHLPKINAPTAWDNSLGQGVTIAILDSGVDGTHPDLSASLVPGWNFYNNNSDTSDIHGHGTKVAGAAGAIGNNAIGVAGVAYNAKIMPIRVSDTTGYGSLSAISQGLVYAADHGARVANLSFYGVETSSSARSAAQYMKNKGGVVTTGAGNYGVEETIAPSDTMITASATGSSDSLASWSSYGNHVEVSAPGVGIWSTVRGGGYGSVSGTSFSSPITAGVIALMMAVNPALGADDLQNILFSTAHDLGTAGYDIYYGHGRVDAAAAVSAALQAAPSDTTAPNVSFSMPQNGMTVKGVIAVNVEASDNVGIARVDLMVNGILLASDLTAPHGFSWDSATVPDGNVTLKATAYDTSGNAASSSITVKVSNTVDVTPPSVMIGSPASNSKIGNTATIAASAGDNIGVTSMKLYIDGALKASTSNSSLSYKWNTRKVSAGAHTIQVTAQDAAGNMGSQSIQVTK